MLVQCNSCEAIFEHNSEYGDICPNCNGVNISEYTINNTPQQQNKYGDKKEYIIYYVKYNMFKVMHKDSHFYIHNQNFNELRDPSQNIRYYTLAGADAAITKMKERDPDWELKMKKIF